MKNTAKSNQHPVHGVDENTALRMIVEGTASETGERFFAALVKNLAKALNRKGAWVTEYLEEEYRLRALAFWLEDDFVDEYEYDAFCYGPFLKSSIILNFCKTT